MKYEFAKRVKRLPPYIFAEIEQLKLEKKKQGMDLIPLGIGDPDLTTPELILNEMLEQAKIPENQNYPTSMGEEDFRNAVAKWYKIRFGLELNPEKDAKSGSGAND